MAASPLPSRGPKIGQKCYATHPFWGVPNKRDQNQKCVPHPRILGGGKKGGNATSFLHSRRSPTPSAGSKIRSDPEQRGTKSEVAASPPTSRGPKKGLKCDVTPAFSGVPNTKREEQNQKWVCHPSILGGPQRQTRGAKSKVVTNKAEQNHKWSPTQGNKLRSGGLNYAFSGAQKRAEMLRHPCILGEPQQRGTISEVAASALPFRGPKRGRKSCVTPAFSGIPNKGEQNQKWLPHPCLLGGLKEGRNATSPLHLGGPQRQAWEVVPNKGQKNQKWMSQPCLLVGPKEGGIARSPLHSPRSPTKGNKSGNLSPAFLRAKKRAEMLRHPCILAVPKQRGAKSKVVRNKGTENQKRLPHPYLLGGGNVTSVLHSRGSPNKGEHNQKWLPHPCLLEGPKEGRLATSPLHSRGARTKGNKIRSGCVTPAFLGVPNAKSGEQNQKWSATKGNKIKSGCLTPAFSGAQKRAEMLRHRCILGGPNKGEQNQTWLPPPCLLGGPQEGGNDTSPLHSRGSPTPSAGSKIRSGHQQRGTKLEV